MIGRNGKIGPVACRLIRSPNQPHWKTATVMPSAAASDSRLDSAPVAGTSIDRNRTHQGQEAQADDDQQEPRQRVGQHLGEVDGHRLEATDVRLRAGVGARPAG